MYPFLTFGALTTNVEHAICEVSDIERRLGYTGGLDTGAQDILIIGEVIRLSDAVNGVKVADECRLAQPSKPDEMRRCVAQDLLFRGIVQLVLSRTLKALLNARVIPQRGYGGANLWWQAVTFYLRWLDKDGLHVVFAATIIEREFERLHGLKNDTHRLDGVAEYDFLERFTLIARVASLVDKLHLFEDGGLSGFAGTWKNRVSPVQRSSSSVIILQKMPHTEE